MARRTWRSPGSPTTEQTTTANVGAFVVPLGAPLRRVPKSWFVDPDDFAQYAAYRILRRAKKKQ
jgi:hypothetical protein